MDGNKKIEKIINNIIEWKLNFKNKELILNFLELKLMKNEQ